jgi:selenium donor protein
LGDLPKITDKNVLVGNSTADDAAVFRISHTRAIVQTVDFFTPIVDEPYWYGAIAAANSLSDVYAMGGRPAFALNIVGFPRRSTDLPLSFLKEILRVERKKPKRPGSILLADTASMTTSQNMGCASPALLTPIESGEMSAEGQATSLS